MKQIIKEYKDQLIYFFTNKKYILSIIFVALLSYGFAITNYSVGVDDLCFDRYVTGTYILSAKRWGTWLLYNILNIKGFSPFWLDFIVAILMVVISTIICAFMRRQCGEKVKIWVYVVFSATFISNPIINQFFIFQSTNLAILISNILIVISTIIIFENYFKVKKRIYNILSVILITIALSMYESCIQTYLVMLFINLYINIAKNNIEIKKIVKYFITSMFILVCGVIGYYITGIIVLKLLECFNVLHENLAFTDINIISKEFLSLSFENKISYINEQMNFFDKIALGVQRYVSIKIFFILIYITLIIELINVFKTNKMSLIITLIGIIASNFLLIVMQLSVLFRTQFSWILTTSFLCIYIYYKLDNKRILKYIINIAVIFIIIFQTRDLNQLFYNDHMRYEHEKVVANTIAIDITKNTNYKDKPIIYISRGERQNNFRTNNDNGFKVLQWGLTAFNDMGVETTKFINYLGYDFLYSTQEQYDEAMGQYDLLDENTKKNALIELDKYIIINLDKYGI